jgi:hypothetical protein
MRKAAKEGSFFCTFSSITDGAIEQLRAAGFSVQEKLTRGISPGSPSYYYEVSFKPKH